MSYVLAIEPHRGQADLLRRAGSRAQTEMTIVDSVDAALSAIDEEVPQLVLASALMPPRQEGELLDRLRDLSRDTAPQILIMPALTSPEMAPPRRTLFHRQGNRNVPPAGCDLSAFVDQLSLYLDQAERTLYDTWSRAPISLVVTRVKSGANRRADLRFERIDRARALVDGARVDLIDLSATGAQVLAPMLLRLDRSVQVRLTRDAQAIDFEAAVVWGGFETLGPTHDICYRAGMIFKETDRGAFERFYFDRKSAPVFSPRKR